MFEHELLVLTLQLRSPVAAGVSGEVVRAWGRGAGERDVRTDMGRREHEAHGEWSSLLGEMEWADMNQERL